MRRGTSSKNKTIINIEPMSVYEGKKGTINVGEEKKKGSISGVVLEHIYGWWREGGGDKVVTRTDNTQIGTSCGQFFLPFAYKSRAKAVLPHCSSICPRIIHSLTSSECEAIPSCSSFRAASKLSWTHSNLADFIHTRAVSASLRASANNRCAPLKCQQNHQY